MQRIIQRVATLTLRGVFLCRSDDIKWFYQHGASEIYPHYWEKYLSIVSKSKRNDILSAYYEMIHSSDEIISKELAKSGHSGKEDHPVYFHQMK